MPKVSVTIKGLRSSRTYDSDYVFVSLKNENGHGDRWVQEPVNWQDGQGLFFSGMTAIKIAAEDKGTEIFKEAARVAMAAMRVCDPEVSLEQKKKKREEVIRLMDRMIALSEKDKKITKKKTTKKTTKKYIKK